MAKRDQPKKTFSLQGFDAIHYKRTEQYVKVVTNLYNRAIAEIADHAAKGKYDPEKPFTFDDYPKTKKYVQEVTAKLSSNIKAVVETGAKQEWLYACQKNDEFLNSILNTSKLEKSTLEQYQDRNLDALKTFQSRKVDGLDLSKRVWRYTEQFKDQIEQGLDVGLGEGRSAQQLSRDLRQNLIEPERLFRRVRDKRGNLQLSKNAKAFNPGQGVYRSSAKNAARLTRSEINMAYRESDWLRWQQLDFVVGFEIKTSNRHEEWLQKVWNKQNHGKIEICDQLKGKYPKWFKFVGWHPQCYSDDTCVLTKRGWVLIDEVEYTDLVLSLNPDTRKPEWAGVIGKQAYERREKMIHYHNKSLDILVTPDHDMVYLNKSDGSIRHRRARDYSKNNGGIYRGCEWDGVYTDTIKIGSYEFKITDFAEFMGYWLSDGSLVRDGQIFIAQQAGDQNRSSIEDCIYRMGIEPHRIEAGINLYSKELNAYLKQFGTATDKFIPDEIKDSNKQVIKIFLDAFISCDGHERECKPFIGNKGSVCVPVNTERVYFTTSKQMAGEICELILKIGKRPSYSVDKLKGKEHKFKNGTYKNNYDLHRIRECNSQTATVFEKEYVNYDGFVIDLTLERNHIMYVARNGKPFWGSNCMCYVTPIIEDFYSKDRSDDRVNRLRSALNGTEYKKYVSKQTITDVPDGLKEWVQNNAEKQLNWKSVPYFIRDNFKGGMMANGLRYSPVNTDPAKPVVSPYSNNMPAQFKPKGEYLRGEDYTFDKRFFDLIDKNNPVKLKISKDGSSYYDPDNRIVNIGNGERNENSRWHRKSAVYHEYGHAIDWRRDLRKSQEIADLREKQIKSLNKKTKYDVWLKKSNGEYTKVQVRTSRVDYIDYRLKELSAKIWRMDESIFTQRGITKMDVIEQIVSTRDTIKSLVVKYGDGHSAFYFSRPWMKEAEYIAHAFENTYIGNEVFKKYLPDIYQEMIDYIRSLK